MMLGKQNRDEKEQVQYISMSKGNQEMDLLVENSVDEERQKLEQTKQGSHHKRAKQVDAKQLISPFIKGNHEHCTFKLRTSKANPTILSKISQDKNTSFNHASKISEQNLQKKSFKHVNSYDQLRDKNLIQYLYTRQNKIFQPEPLESTHESNCNTQHIRTRKVKRSPINILARKLKLSRRESQPFQVRNDCSRNVEYNAFDAFSYEQSLKQNSQSKICKGMRPDEPRLQRNNKPELMVFKERINKLQESVFHKVPFLIQMGVKFKQKQ